MTLDQQRPSVKDVIGNIDPDQYQCFCCKEWFKKRQVFYRKPGSIKKLNETNSEEAYICFKCVSFGSLSNG